VVTTRDTKLVTKDTTQDTRDSRATQAIKDTTQVLFLGFTNPHCIIVDLVTIITNFLQWLGVNRGYYPGAPAVSVFPAAPAAVTPAPIIAPAPAKIAAPVYKAVDNKLPAIVRQSQEVNFDGNFKYGLVPNI
jgi:hypothetical protein